MAASVVAVVVASVLATFASTVSLADDSLFRFFLLFLSESEDDFFSDLVDFFDFFSFFVSFCANGYVQFDDSYNTI